MKCKYAAENWCALGSIFNKNISVKRSWCADRCWPNHVPAQLAMLRRLGIDLPELPEDRDLLEWATECVENGTVKLSDAAEKAQQQKKETEAKRQELLDQLPKGVELTENLKRHLKQIARHYVRTFEYYVTDEHEVARLSECNKCPEKQMVIKEGVMRCALPTCGCYLNNPTNRPLLKGKAKYWATPCDNGHWDGIDAKFRLTTEAQSKMRR